MGGRFPCDLEFDHHDGFQGAAWLISAEEKKIETSVWIIHAQPVAGGNSQFSGKSLSDQRPVKDLRFTRTHSHLLTPVWAET